MANKVRINKDGTVTGRWSPAPGAAELLWRFPDEKALRDFTTVEKAMKATGTPVPHPQDVVGDGAKAPRSAERHLLRQYTVSEWIGADDRGPFFTYRKCDAAEVAAHQRLVTRDIAGFANKPLHEVTPQDAERFVHMLLVCPFCVLRADSANDTERLARPDLHLRADQDPYGGECVAPDGTSTHHPAHRRTTIERWFKKFKRIFQVAIQVGATDNPDDPRCSGIVQNPFRWIKLGDYKYTQRPANVDFKRSLTYDEVERLAKAVPRWAEAAIWVGTYAMLRGGELLALDRGMITWPSSLEDRGQACIRITHTIDRKGNLKEGGKNSRATGTPIWIPREITDILRAHLEEHRSKASPDDCPACARGAREHRDAKLSNQHRRCDFADDAPLFVMPSTLKRCPTAYFGKEVINPAVRKAGLDQAKYRPTLHSLRMTGANLRLEDGQQFEIVRIQGRWALGSTLFDWYVRPTVDAILDGNDSINGKIRASRGLDDEGQRDLAEELARLRILLEARNTEIARLKHEIETGKPPARGTRGTCHRARLTLESVREILPYAKTASQAADLLGVSTAGKNLAKIRDLAREAGGNLSDGRRLSGVEKRRKDRPARREAPPE